MKRSKKLVQAPTKITKTDALVTVVIPVYNRFDMLEKCLLALPAAFSDSVKIEVVIVDNGSDKEIADRFYSGLHDVTIIRNRENTGFPHAVNQGAKRTRTPLIFLLNSDVVMDPGSGIKLVQKMDDPTVGICGMKLVFPNNPTSDNPTTRPSGKLQHIGLSVNVRADVHHPFIGWDENHPKVMHQSVVWGVTGAALMVRRSIWNQTQGLWEGYGIGTYEDCDLCMSAREMGYNIHVVPTARGIHYTGASAEANKVMYPLQQNKMLFMQRWQQKIQWWDGYVL